MAEIEFRLVTGLSTWRALMKRMRGVSLIALLLMLGCGQGPTTPTPVVPAPVTPTPTTPRPTVPFPTPAPVPSVTIVASPSPLHAGTVVHVILQFSVLPSTVTIDFGDGTVINLGAVASADVAHVYANAGVFTVKVTVTWPNGSHAIATTGLSVIS